MTPCFCSLPSSINVFHFIDTIFNKIIIFIIDAVFIKEFKYHPYKCYVNLIPVKRCKIDKLHYKL